MACMGQYGVQLFFVISAITIFMTLEMDHARCGDARHVTLRFYIKRFFRIAPLYYVAIAVYGLISYSAMHTGIDRAWILGAHGPVDVLLNMLFLHALSPTAINNVVPGGWSIGVEMLFYMIAPLLFFLAMNRTRLLLASASLLAISFAVTSMSDCNGTLECNVSNNSFSYFWPPVQWPCFIVGMWAWYAFHSHLLGASDVPRHAPWLYLAIALGFGLLTAALGVWLAKAHALAPIFAACSAVAFLLFVCTRHAHKTRAHTRALSFPGKTDHAPMRGRARTRKLWHLSLALHLRLCDVPFLRSPIRHGRSSNFFSAFRRDACGCAWHFLCAFASIGPSHPRPRDAIIPALARARRPAFSFDGRPLNRRIVCLVCNRATRSRRA